MSKKINSYTAAPFGKFFEELESSAAGTPLQLANQLSLITNEDVCVTYEQQRFIKVLLSIGAIQVKDNVNSHTVVANIATLVNSFRFDCANCLNKDCEMRDPEKPLKQ